MMNSPFDWQGKPSILSAAIKPSPKARANPNARVPFTNSKLESRLLRSRHCGAYSKAGKA